LTIKEQKNIYEINNNNEINILNDSNKNNDLDNEENNSYNFRIITKEDKFLE